MKAVAVVLFVFVVASSAAPLGHERVRDVLRAYGLEHLESTFMPHADNSALPEDDGAANAFLENDPPNLVDKALDYVDPRHMECYPQVQKKFTQCLINRCKMLQCGDVNFWQVLPPLDSSIFIP